MIVEWCCSSYFSFLEGATAPLEMMREAESRGYAGLGLGDRMGLYGLVEAMRGYEEIQSSRVANAKTSGDRPFFYAPGIRIHFDHADPLFIYPLHKKAHGKLCRFLSEWALAGLELREKGLAPIPWTRFRDFLREERARARLAESYLFFSISGRFYPWPSKESEAFKRSAAQDTERVAPTFSIPPTQDGQCPFWLIELAELCGRGLDSALSLVWPLTLAPGCEDLQKWLLEHSRKLRVPLVASSLPLFGDTDDFELARLVGSIRHRKPLKDMGLLGQVNSQRRFLSERELRVHQRIWQEVSRSEDPDPFRRSVALTERHAFSLRELSYRYPAENIPKGESTAMYFERLVHAGERERYPDGTPSEIAEKIRHELSLIRELGYEDYFLTIHDVLQYARSRKILYQGRGSAANSVVCFCLGITSINPVEQELLFERFLSRERAEAPDIDIDFEHERREEVLQEIYSRYGRHRAAMVANTIRFRGRMAMREAATALGIEKEQITELATYMGREGFSRLVNQPQGIPASVTPQTRRRLPTLIRLASQLYGIPRHLGIHSCGFVLAEGDLREQCILEPARKEMRSVIPWNKDDIDVLKWVKVDFLSLGMLTAVRKCFDLIGNRNVTGHPLTLRSLPKECPKVYAAARRADTVGVFQIESRAQMNMLPRLAPRNFYDLVIQIAIVRPGPIQGGMVHPYLLRRQGRGGDWEKDEHVALKPILAKTLGVPIFQEQVMRMATAVGGFTPGEADKMRKVMSGAWRSKSEMHKLRDKLLEGMWENGLTPEYAERIYRQMEGFGEYGFPESHSASFAIIAYDSAWLKIHHPSEFLCGLLNSQPMGFYSARALVGDARRHGVLVLPPNISRSRWDSSLDFSQGAAERPAVRLGLRLIKSLSESEGKKIEALQDAGILGPRLKFDPVALRVHLAQKTLETLVKAGACREMEREAVHDPRPQQVWDLMKTRHEDPGVVRLIPLAASPLPHDLVEKNWSEWSSIVADYRTAGLSLRAHPARHARQNFFPMMAEWKTAEALWRHPSGGTASVLGLLAIKQKPPTAGGMCFLTLEDETGFFNLSLKPDIYERFRMLMDRVPLLAARGKILRSFAHDPRDPRSAAMSLEVENMWDPFQKIKAPLTRERLPTRRTNTQAVDNV